MKGFAKLVEFEAGFTLEELFSAIAQATGTRLESTWDGVVWEWTNEGDRIQSSADQLIRSLNGSASVHFQMWFEDGVDLFCSVDKLTQEQIVHTYGFGGLDQVQAARVREFVLSRFKQKAVNGKAVLVVVDESGSTEDYDWLAIREHRVLPTRLPEIVGFNRDLVVGLASEGAFENRTNLELGSCLLSFVRGN